MNHALQVAMAEAGETTESLAAQTGVDPKTAARWISPGRVPQPRRRAKLAALLGRDVGDLWPDVLKRREPQWLREWVDWEREAVAIRWFEHTWVPGLLQTDAYARATLTGEALTLDEVDDVVASASTARPSFAANVHPFWSQSSTNWSCTNRRMATGH